VKSDKTNAAEVLSLVESFFRFENPVNGDIGETG
jgi:hypothetical protein